VTGDWLRADWPAPAGVRAFSTTRIGGVSPSPWASLNLGENCGDGPDNVRRNRERVVRSLPAEPLWLRQVHGTRVARHSGPEREPPEADAAVAFDSGRVCAVLTADCLPVLLTDRAGSRVAAVHAGWRGLAAGVIAAAVQALDTEPADLLAWLGPAIGPAAYEVGSDVLDAMRAAPGPDPTPAFRPRRDRWLLDLYAVARLQLEDAGVQSIHGGGLCTFSDAARFYSFRRDGVTGRMASLIWLEAS
jgi:YfiH family protein